MPNDVPGPSPLEVALDTLEALECQSLAWGFVDAFTLHQDLITAITHQFAEKFITDDPEDILEVLEDKLLVRSWIEGHERAYRSRLAELVRLLAKLRQQFGPKDWRSAPSLVSDFRLEVSARRYPKRNIKSEEVREIVSKQWSNFNATQSVIWNTLFPKARDWRFAQFQIDALCRVGRGHLDHGTVITAGTGSGKTLSFYLPALLAISEQVKRREAFTKVLSIYPRNELLKDQLTEVFSIIHKLNRQGPLGGSRFLSLGAIYGDVPHGAFKERLSNLWAKGVGGYICPFLKCPECGSKTIWKEPDISSRREILCCMSCEFQTLPGEICLTRYSIKKQPPDFLFSTTEMLNQRISDPEMHHVFGIGIPGYKKPTFILLDEIHTYQGVVGAQTALALRRWKKLLAHGVHWVGLSATLEDAPAFFSDLTGVSEDKIENLSPKNEEIFEEGADYQILLRANPASKTSTLSTSIQTLMLSARMLDTREKRQSDGLFGTRVFAFSDDLDLINRLFDNLKDAEAYKPWGQNLIDSNREPLARYRGSDLADTIEREQEGQLWRLAEDLRGSLENRLFVGRTTSRDPGLIEGSDVIVATSSLEVGFNDTEVGLVLQHKAPRSNASFLQRKGRAGRRRGMRPITVTVLSDYGRDRQAFQSFEKLFAPIVQRQKLPTKNLYILKIQAAFALMDWLALESKNAGVSGWPWKELSQPKKNLANGDFRQFAQEQLLSLLRLEKDTIESLKEYFLSALQINSTTADLVLWENPRSILLEVVPTLLRRVYTDWRIAGTQNQFDFYVPWHPMPDFVPRELFGELILPEVGFLVPQANSWGEEKRESLKILQALSEFCPGRVRRRFSDRNGNIAHWVPVDTVQESQDLSLESYATEAEFLGSFPTKYGDGVNVYRPWTIELSELHSSSKISHSSNSSWDWESNFEFNGEKFTFLTPPNSHWFEIIKKADFYIHRLNGAVTVRRYAHRAEANLLINGQNHRSEIYLRDRDGEQSAAVGFAYEGDGVYLAIDKDKLTTIESSALSAEVTRSLKFEYYDHCIASHEELPKTLNKFMRDWLAMTCLHAALTHAEQQGVSITTSFSRIGSNQASEHLTSSIDMVMGTVQDPDGSDTESKLRNIVEEHLNNDVIRKIICDVGHRITSNDFRLPQKWLQKLFVQTIGETVLNAFILCTPDNVGLDDLCVDVVEIEGHQGILVVETTPGGAGTIETLVEKFSADPRSFGHALTAAIEKSDTELVSIGLEKILNELISDQSVKDQLRNLREATNSEKRTSERKKFAAKLTQKGLQLSRSLSVAFATRFAHAGANEKTDKVTAEIFEYWAMLEAKHGIALPMRVVARIAELNPELADSLSSIGARHLASSTAERLLWPKARDADAFAIQSYNPYRPEWSTNVHFARELINEREIDVVLMQGDWQEHAVEILREKKSVGLTANLDGDQFSKTILAFLDSPITRGHYQFYPFIEGFKSIDDVQSMVVVSIRELM